MGNGVDRAVPRTAALALCGILAGCAGSLSHIETTKRLQATYAGFPPVFPDPALAGYRAQYLHDKAAFDASPRAFLHPAPAGQPCALPPDARQVLAKTSFRLPIQERSPSWADYMNKAGHGYLGSATDRINVTVLQGNCSGGAINGRAQVLLRYINVLNQANSRDFYKVYEVTALERCGYRNNVRDGECTRYTRQRVWHGVMVGGKLVHLANSFAAMYPKQAKIRELEEDDFEYITVFDYGQYRNGIESGPGVSFETSPINGKGTHVVENHTLARRTLPDGRVQYDEYYGGTHKVRYVMRDGVAHGTLAYSPGQAGTGPEKICFEDGTASLRAQCPD